MLTDILNLENILYKQFSDLWVIDMDSDLRDDQQFFVDHPGSVPITAAQVKFYAHSFS